MNDPAEGLTFASNAEKRRLAHNLGEGSEQTRPLKEADTTTRPPAAPISPTIPAEAELAKPQHVRGIFARIRARVRKWLQERHHGKGT